MKAVLVGLKSRHTTIAGILVEVIAILSQLHNHFDDDPATVFSIEIIAAATVACYGLIVSRDSFRSSEDAGAKSTEGTDTAL